MEYLIYLIAGLGLLLVVFIASHRGRIQKRQAIARLEDAPFNAGVSQGRQLAELKDSYESKKDLDQINRLGAP